MKDQATYVEIDNFDHVDELNFISARDLELKLQLQNKRVTSGYKVVNKYQHENEKMLNERQTIKMMDRMLSVQSLLNQEGKKPKKRKLTFEEKRQLKIAQKDLEFENFVMSTNSAYDDNKKKTFKLNVLIEDVTKKIEKVKIVENQLIQNDSEGNLYYFI